MTPEHGSGPGRHNPSRSEAEAPPGAPLDVKCATASRPPAVCGGVSVDISGCVDRHGWVDQADAVRLVWSAAYDLPPGCALEVRLGWAKCVEDRVVALLAELIVEAKSVYLIGADANITGRWVAALRAELERWSW